MKIKDFYFNLKKDHEFKKIHDQHPIDLFLGIENEKYTILIICDAQPVTIPNLEFLKIQIRQRKRGSWALIIQLENINMIDIFCKLTEDLITVTSFYPKNPEITVINRILKWKKLLTAKNQSKLKSIKGFIGELSFLFYELLPALGDVDSLQSWVGPYGSPKDFIFDQAEVEVKSTSLSTKFLQINSIEQLTDMGKPLFLWHQPLEILEKYSNGYQNLFEWFSDIKTHFSSNENLSIKFENAISSNLDIDQKILRSLYFKLYHAQCYRVTTNFPRIQVSSNTLGITECRYKLNLSYIQTHKVSTWRQT